MEEKKSVSLPENAYRELKAGEEYEPIMSAQSTPAEATPYSVTMGVIMAIIFSAAAAFLGLKVGQVFEAAIPIAILAAGFGSLRGKNRSMLGENVIIQSIGASSGVIVAGAIFTLPALFLWASESPDSFQKPGIIEITLIALIGGLLGVFFMIPLRNALIVKEHGVLPYPEGTACAEVLLAGEEGGANASTVFAGMGFAAIFKFIVDGIKAVPSEINLAFSKFFKGYNGEIGTQVYPALVSVGFICGPRISSYMFAGGVLSWMVLIPLICLFGAEAIIYPGTTTIGEMFADGGAGNIWGSYIRYIGAGALAAGGIISLIKSLPLIVKTFGDALKGMSSAGTASNERTSKDINFKVVIAIIVVLTFLIWLVPAIPVSLLGASIIVVFGFFFATVSSRMVGLVGSSNNPVSGMAIATLLVSTLLLKATGDVGAHGMTAAIAIGSIICIVAAISGDTSQDLKTGFLLGATPRKQQIGEIIGVVASAFAIGGTLYLLDAAWGFGSPELGAPQATLMKMIIEGVMEGNLPWALVFTGVFIAVVVEVIGIPVLPFAIGIYLPVQLNACIMIGGLVRLFIEKRKNADEKKKEAAITNGTLFCSGMIAGEGLVGILLAVFAVFGIDKAIDLSGKLGLPAYVSNILGVVVLALIVLCVVKFSLKKDRK